MKPSRKNQDRLEGNLQNEEQSNLDRSNRDLEKRFHSSWSLASSRERSRHKKHYQEELAAKKVLEEKMAPQLKSISKEPAIPAMTPATRRFFRLKALYYLFCHDRGWQITKQLLRNPLKYLLLYSAALARSFWRGGKSFVRDEDFFFYGVVDEAQWLKEVRGSDTLLVLGFSYCHKPLECPSGRFTDRCVNDREDPVCQGCFISQLRLVERYVDRVHFVMIPTVHAIGHELFKLRAKHPDKKLLFLITACEMTLEMFGEFGALVSAQGIGVRLGGRICNTMRAFELSEEGIKPGLTRILEPTKQRMAQLLEALVDEAASKL